jgi:hypothetical protein
LERRFWFTAYPDQLQRFSAPAMNSITPSNHIWSDANPHKSVGSYLQRPISGLACFLSSAAYWNVIFEGHFVGDLYAMPSKVMKQ